MISTRLQGGLGNQMFQISAAHALATRNNDIAVFNFNDCFTPLQGHTSNRYRHNILSKINIVDSYQYSVFYNEPRFGYEELPYINNMLLNGCFQSEKYFLDCKQEIIDLFPISDLHKSFIRKMVPIFNNLDKPITSVNIRRGDYLKNPSFHLPCPYEYFKKAMDMIGDSYFIFLSDDLDWAIEKFSDSPNNFFPRLNDDILDLTLMTMCNNNILSNSTFSWWGTYLNQNSNVIRIGPERWFGPAGHQDYGDVLPQNWLKIDNNIY
jgi:hypothetical protein